MNESKTAMFQLIEFFNNLNKFTDPNSEKRQYYKDLVRYIEDHFVPIEKEQIEKAYEEGTHEKAVDELYNAIECPDYYNWKFNND